MDIHIIRDTKQFKQRSENWNGLVSLVKLDSMMQEIKLILSFLKEAAMNVLVSK